MKFAGHESFHIREGWLRKGLAAIERDPFIFFDEYPEDDLGVGHNMVSAIRYWLHACRLAEIDLTLKGDKQNAKGYRPTALGRHLSELDPHFELKSTWWILHYELASNFKDATAWQWLFNSYPSNQFDSETFVSSLKAFASSRGGAKISDNSFDKDFHCIIRSYVSTIDNVQPKVAIEDSLDSPFARLGLIESQPNSRQFRLTHVDSAGIDSASVAYGLLRYVEQSGSTSPTVAFQDVLRGEGSPGKIFRLTADNLFEHLETLAREKVVDYSRTAGLNTITLRERDPYQLFLKKTRKEKVAK